jgi:hypothetical protein
MYISGRDWVCLLARRCGPGAAQLGIWSNFLTSSSKCSPNCWGIHRGCGTTVSRRARSGQGGNFGLRMSRTVSAAYE